MAKAICYGRVSTGEQAETGHGLDAQRRKCESYCAAFDLEPTEWIEDAGVSGAVSPADRGGLSRALQSLAAGEAEALVTASLSRLARRTRDALELADRASSEGWRLVILDLSLDTSTPTGRLALTVLAAVAELEREQTRERTRDALAAAKAKGVRLGSPASRRTREAGALVEGLRAEGLRWREVVEHLEARGVPTAKGKAGAGAWSITQARRALQTIALDREAAGASA